MQNLVDEMRSSELVDQVYPSETTEATGAAHLSHFAPLPLCVCGGLLNTQVTTKEEALVALGQSLCLSVWPST